MHEHFERFQSIVQAALVVKLLRSTGGCDNYKLYICKWEFAI